MGFVNSRTGLKRDLDNLFDPEQVYVGNLQPSFSTSIIPERTSVSLELILLDRLMLLVFCWQSVLPPVILKAWLVRSRSIVANDSARRRKEGGQESSMSLQPAGVIERVLDRKPPASTSDHSMIR